MQAVPRMQYDPNLITNALIILEMYMLRLLPSKRVAFAH
jgi:hypothetical protein